MNPMMLMMALPMLKGRGGLGGGLKISSAMLVGAAMFGAIPKLSLGLPSITLPGVGTIDFNDIPTLGVITGIAPLNTAGAMLGITGAIPELAAAGRMKLFMQALGLGGGLLGGGRRARRSKRYRSYRSNRRWNGRRRRR